MQHRSLFLVPFLLVACSGEPFHTADGASDGGGWQRVPHPGRADVSAPPAAALISAHADGGVMALSAADGAVLARGDLNGPILDLTWDGPARRALIAQGEADVDGSRIRALSYDGTVFSTLGESDAFEGQARLWVNAAGTLVMTEGPAASWTLLDATLTPAGLPKALLAPAGLADDAPGDAHGWIALDANVFDGQTHADALISVQASPKWSFTRLLVPAPQRPGSRLAHARGTDELYLVRKHDDESSFAIGQTTVAQPAAPSFVVAEGAEATGELVEVVVVPERDALLALVAPAGADHTRVVRLPVAGGVSAAVEVPGRVQPSAGFGRHAATAGGGRVVIATSAGAFALQISATAVSVDADFVQPAARPPLVSLTDT